MPETEGIPKKAPATTPSLTANLNIPVLALDLSSTCTGWAVGEMGKAPVITGSIRPDKKTEYTDAERFLYFWNYIQRIYTNYKCQFILAEELNHFTNARTARLLAGLAGAISVLAKKELESEVIFLNTQKSRAAIAVDLTWDIVQTPKGPKKVRPDVKKRVAKRLEWFGIKGLPEDEADAAVILLAAGKLIQVGRKK